jgi:putative transposase
VTRVHCSVGSRSGQELLEAEMTEALGAEKGERTPARLGHRSGYYGRTLVTR